MVHLINGYANYQTAIIHENKKGMSDPDLTKDRILYPNGTLGVALVDALVRRCTFNGNHSNLHCHGCPQNFWAFNINAIGFKSAKAMVHNKIMNHLIDQETANQIKEYIDSRNPYNLLRLVSPSIQYIRQNLDILPGKGQRIFLEKSFEIWAFHFLRSSLNLDRQYLRNWFVRFCRG